MGRFALAFGIEPGWTVSAVGGGGKMSLLVTLASEWAAAGGRPLLTTTTRMFGPRFPPEFDLITVQAAESPTFENQLSGRHRHGHVVILARGEIRPGLLEGFDERTIRRAGAALGADLILVKADGARGRSLKAHRTTEPVFPARTHVVLAVAGVDAWGLPISEETVHRAELFCEQWGYAPGEPIDDEAYVLALSDPRGYRWTVPAAARYIVFLNKADNPSRVEIALRLARRLADRDVETFWGDVWRGLVEAA